MMVGIVGRRGEDGDDGRSGSFHPRNLGRRGSCKRRSVVWCWRHGGGVGDGGEDVSELLESGTLYQGCGRQGRGVGRVEESGNEILSGGGGEFEGGGSGHVYVRREPCESVGNAFGQSGVGPDGVAPIVERCGAKVPTFDGVGSPSFAHG